MRPSSLILLAAALAVLGQNPDEWPILHNVNHTSFSPTTVLKPPLKVRWMTKVPGQFQNPGPVVAEGKVVVTDERGYIFCLDAETGELLWRHFHARYGYVVISSPCISNGRVYATSFWRYNPSTTGMRCFDLNTGEVLWFRHSGHVNARVKYSPQVSHGRLFYLSNVDVARSTTGGGEDYRVQLQCWNAVTGDSLWTYTVFGSACNNTTFLNTGDTIYASVGRAVVNWRTDTGRTVALDTNGNLLWESSEKSKHVTYYLGNLQYQPGKLWFVSDSGTQVLSTADRSFLLHNAPGDDYTKVFALMNGRHWQSGYAQPPVGYNSTTGAVEVNSRLFSGDVYGSGCSTPVAANGYIYKGFGGPYAPCTISKIYAFDETGAPAWSYPGGTHWCPSPAIAYGRLYAVTGGEGTVYCFENAE
jgi:outer membrane protein assembly factor BamB